MNPTLLKSQFDRLAKNPGDTRLLKQLAVEFGSAVVRGRSEWLREYRLAAASALRTLEGGPDAVASAHGALCALLDAAASAEEVLAAERGREDVRALAARPLHQAALRALDGRALTTTALADQLDKHKSQVSEALRELETAGLVRGMEGSGGDGRSKPYRLTLAGSAVLDELPAITPAPTDASELNDWDVLLRPNFEMWPDAGSSWPVAAAVRVGRVLPFGPISGRQIIFIDHSLNGVPSAVKLGPRPEFGWDGQRSSRTPFRNRISGLMPAGS